MYSCFGLQCFKESFLLFSLVKRATSAPPLMLHQDVLMFQCTPCREGVGWMEKIVARFGESLS